MVVRYDAYPSPGERLAGDGSAAKLHKNIERWLQKGITLPGLCFIFEEGGEPVGGVVFASFVDTELEVLDFQLEKERYADGARLLGQGCKEARAPVHRLISYNLYDDSGEYGDMLRIFREAGFDSVQEKKSYERGGEPLDRLENPLELICRERTGDEAFLRAVERVSEKTLDRLMAKNIERLGAQAAAREYFDSLVSIDDRPDWWKLAYTGGELAGLIIPQSLGKITGAINYIGVCPEYRGRGFGRLLIYEGVKTLVAAGHSKIIADIDALNGPMQSALESLGFKFGCDETVLEMNWIQ